MNTEKLLRLLASTHRSASPILAYAILFISGSSWTAPAAEAAPAPCPGSVTVGFPATGPRETEWQLCYRTESGSGLIIEYAYFLPTGAPNPIKILGDARVSEIFVPYHLGSPRFFDLSQFNFPLLTLSTRDCPRAQGGRLIAEGKVCKQVRDRGVAWKDDANVRRGQELLLWSVIGSAASYNYIIEWSFHDDGTIVGRAGSTGNKLGGPDDETGHMHNFTWRLNVDLNGSSGDSVSRSAHVEPCHGDPLQACDADVPITRETGIKWNPLEFTTVKISDATLVNGRGRKTAYELIPYRVGTARHDEAYSKNDFWVTRRRASEVLPIQLPSYVANGESVSNADLVVWYTGSVHHSEHMRDEDRDTVPVKWVGFELSPQNLFDGTPLY